MTILVERYRAEQCSFWNDFVASSKNGTFLFDRNYMDYHSDRFVDHSLILRTNDGAIVALLPANQHDKRLHSHAGLTYGGLVLGARTGAALVIDMLEAVIHYLRANQLTTLHYKTIPSIYHRQPAEEDRYAMFRMNAILTRRDVLSVVPPRERLRFQDRRKRGVKAAVKAGVQVIETTDFSAFWQVLSGNLRERFGVAPVHSLGEMELLHSRFPQAIRLFTAELNGVTVAGSVVFETERVAHVQYISANEHGRCSHALDAIFDHLLTRIYSDKDFFDFGISNEDAGRTLNTGLLEQKEGFGARCIVHDYYDIAA